MHRQQPHPTFDFGGKTVVVTGGGAGLGRGIALRFAGAGASVVVHYHSNSGGAEETAALIVGDGGIAATVQADLREATGAQQLVDAVRESFGRIDVLVNNAGSYPVTPLLEMPADEWSAVVRANLNTAFYCTQAAARQMVSQGDGGAIVNIASIEANSPAYGHSHYNASKAGVIMLTRSSAYELGSHNIRVNSVSPGLINREGIEQAWPQGVASWRAAAPLARLGEPHEIADACLFLASPFAGWITGSDLVVDGGASCRPVF